MPVISRKMTFNGESHKRFLERNERKENRMKMSPSTKAIKERVGEPEGKRVQPLIGTPENPAPQKERDGDRYGVTTGLRMNAAFCKLLQNNEDPKKGHKDDDELREIFLAEFPNRNNKGILYNVREVRWRYNFGKLTLDSKGNPQPPEVQSIRYQDGEAFVRRTSKTGMSAAEQALKLEERQSNERERRTTEDEKFAKAEKRFNELREKIDARRKAWEEKNGELPGEAKPVEKQKVLKKTK